MGFPGPPPLTRTDRMEPVQLSIVDKKENLIYILKRVFEIPGAFGHSDIDIVSTNKEMVFRIGNESAKKEFYKSKKLGEWNYSVLIYDNESGKFLDKVDIPRYKE